MGKTIHRKMTVGDIPRREDPHRTIYEHLDTKKIRDMVMVSTLIWESLNEALKKAKGAIVVQEDIMVSLSRGASVPLKFTAPVDAIALTKGVLRDAKAILSNCFADSGEEAALAACYLIHHLVEAEVLADPGNFGVLAAMAIMADAQEEGGDNPWPMCPVRIPMISERMRERSRYLGYF